MDLPLKYRPTSLDDIVGQEAVVKSLRSLLKKKEKPKVFLFSGDSGVGKTTISKIIGIEVGCDPGSILEIDAATNSGIDAMKQVVDMVRYRSVGKSPNRCLIIDECHALSKAAWQSLLIFVENTPDHVYVCFCTTELSKVPKTIVTRAHAYTLSLISSTLLKGLIDKVCVEEDIKLPSKAASFIASESGGSARQALTYLSMCSACKKLEQVKTLLQAASEDTALINLYRGLVQGSLDWKAACAIVRGLVDVNFESARIQMMHYMSRVAESGNSSNAGQALAVLEAFSKPFNRSTERPEFILALGKVLLGEDD